MYYNKTVSVRMLFTITLTRNYNLLQAEQVDVYYLKPGAVCKLNHCYSMYCSSINDVTSKLCELRLITKEHIVMHTHLIIWLHTLVI